MNHIDVGRSGEQLAQTILKEKGYKILATNYRFGKGEVDLIGIYEDTIVFVEVKTRTSTYISPTHSVNRKKQIQLVKVANEYIKRNNISLNARFDVVSIVKTPNSLFTEHIIDAFYPLIL